MSNALNELHGRIDQRSRQRARGGRAWFAMAKAILIPVKAASVVPSDAEIAARGLCEQVDMAETFPFRSFELTTAEHALEYLEALFDAAVERGLDPLLERRKGQSVMRVICSAVDWASVRMEAMRK